MRRRSWEPPRGAAARAPAPMAEAGGTRWERWPGHVVVARPPCSTPGCTRPAMHWTRCPCRAPIASCADCPGLERARAAHRASCARMREAGR